MARGRTSAAIAAAVLALAGACSRARTQEADTRSRVSWQEEVAPLFSASCASCHAGPTAAAGYDATTYQTAIRAAAAGDSSSRLLTVLDPKTANAVHARFADAFPTVRDWVVAGRLSFFRSAIHEGGILNPADPVEFHGAVLRQQHFAFGTCQGCHGADFAGGKSGVSCRDCHTDKEGPTSCTTCHGQPPASGAHLAHASGKLSKALDCTECHVKPARYDDPGHLFASDGSVKTKATVTPGALAATPTATRTGPPMFTASEATCSNIYCHGGAFADAKATNTAPVWTQGPLQASCGSCHGLPPANHVSTARCEVCHGAVTGLANALLTPALHLTGVTHFGGEGPGECATCHGSGGTNAPATGAHQAHLKSTHGLSAPVACSTCHVVPATVDEPGHISPDGRPARVVFSGLADALGAQPVFNPITLGCSATHCHGDATPTWTGPSVQASCGTCHGVPPKTSAHAGNLGLGDCFKCHAASVGPAGDLLPAHLNGVVDVRAP